MYFTYSEYTSAGLKRQNNQDSIFSSAKDDFGLFIVADGMGGHFGGEIASGMLKTAFSEWWNSFDGETEFDECCEQIKKIIEETNAAIYNQYSSQGKICGTTLALLFFYKDRYLLINTGDSRIYSYCRGKLRQESVDHVFSEEKKITGELTADEIAEHRNKNKLTSAIGCKKNFKMNIRTAPYNKKTTFFMCSDGVYKLCNDKFIKRAVGMKNSDAMTEILKNNIETNGATDNFSFIKIACAEKNEGEVFMKSKLKIIIPIAIAITAIILAFIFIQFKPEETQVEADPLDIAQSYLVEQSYEQAIAEFKKVIELDPMNVDAYIGIAEAYEAMGDIDSAVEWLKKGYEFTGDGRILDYLNRLEAIVETTAVTEETTTVVETTTVETTVETTSISIQENSDGGYFEYSYNNDGNIVHEDFYDADGKWFGSADIEYWENGNKKLVTYYREDGSYYISEYDEEERLLKRTNYNADGTIFYYTIYDGKSNGRSSTHTDYYADGSVRLYRKYEFDENDYPVYFEFYDSEAYIEETYITMTQSSGTRIYVAEYNDTYTECYTYPKNNELPGVLFLNYTDVCYSYNNFDDKNAESISYYVFNEKRKVISSKNYNVVEDGSEVYSGRTESFYDENDNLIKKVDYNYNDSIISYEIIIYDGLNNEVSTIMYDNDGSILWQKLY